MQCEVIEKAFVGLGGKGLVMLQKNSAGVGWYTEVGVCWFAAICGWGTGCLIKSSDSWPDVTWDFAAHELKSSIIWGWNGSDQ